MTLNLEKYRSSREYREILRILQKASSMQENFLWQSGPLGKNIIQIHHFEIDFVSREVVVFYDTLQNSIELGLPLYVKLDYRTSVFKVTDYRKGQSSLHFTFPKEIKTQELRLIPRHSFSPSVEKYISIRPSYVRETTTELYVRVIDVSIMGVSLVISERNRSFIKNNRIFWITRLQDQLLSHPVLAEVVYITNELDSRYQKKQKELKVGLKLSGVFPEENFRDFIK